MTRLGDITPLHFVSIRPPTFDEWFQMRNAGRTFDDVYLGTGSSISIGMLALSRELRAYVSEIAAGKGAAG